MTPTARRWLAVCLLPPAAAAWFWFRPAADGTDYLINGIILACLCVFLFKYVLFALIGAHLRGDPAARKQAAWQFVPLLLFTVYIVFYFVAGGLQAA